MNEFEERLTQEDEREADRFAAALDDLDAGRLLPVEPEDAPDLYEDLRTVARLRATADEIGPRTPYRVRSRALLIEASAPLARRRERNRPVVSRTSFLVPFASAAAAAGLTIAAVLGATSLGYGPGGRGSSTGPTVAANLTRRSIQEDLYTLQSTLDAVVSAANRGEELSPALLRSITETTLSVTALIETSPQSVRNEDVISYFQTAAATNLRLGEIAPRVSSTPATSALGTARQASEDAVFAAGKRLQAIEEELALGQRNP
jgi:hypothetical protein